jgi:hypothetical protein
MTTPHRLYHFTSRPWWHFIQTEGITRGDTPTSWTEGVNFLNLTSNAGPLGQHWCDRSSVRKTSVRIAVEIPAGDANLIRFRDFADKHGMDRRVYRGLDERGGWQARNWG